jgi:hypothetical protein
MILKPLRGARAARNCHAAHTSGVAVVIFGSGEDH